jgi:hypothetical protein
MRGVPHLEWGCRPGRCTDDVLITQPSHLRNCIRPGVPEALCETFIQLFGVDFRKIASIYAPFVQNVPLSTIAWLVEPLALWAYKMDENALSSSKLSEYGHPGRISAERPDVTLDPLPGCELVEKPVSARDAIRGLVIEIGMCEETKSTGPVISRPRR